VSVWSRTLVYLGLREEPDDAFDWQVVEDAEPIAPAVESPTRRTIPGVPRTATQGTQGTPAAARPAVAAEATSNVRPLRGPSDLTPGRVTVVQVRVFDDVQTIGARYRLNNPVLFDASACSREVARRVIDFVAGLIYAGGGTFTRTASRAFLLVPDGVDITLDERRRLSQLGYDVEGVAR
jgi:cell division inhibitor SepF